MDPTSVNFAHILLSLKDSDSSSSEEEGCSEEISQVNDFTDSEDYSINNISGAFQKASYCAEKQLQVNKKMKMMETKIDTGYLSSPSPMDIIPRVSSKRFSEEIFAATQILHQVKHAVNCSSAPSAATDAGGSTLHRKQHHTNSETSTKYATNSVSVTCNRGNYRCGLCGQLKSNHVCGGGGKVVLFNAETQTTNVAMIVEQQPRDKDKVFAWLEKTHGKERILTVRPRPPSTQ